MGGNGQAVPYLFADGPTGATTSALSPLVTAFRLSLISGPGYACEGLWPALGSWKELSSKGKGPVVGEEEWRFLNYADFFLQAQSGLEGQSYSKCIPSPLVLP